MDNFDDELEVVEMDLDCWEEFDGVSDDQLRGEVFDDMMDMYRNEY